VKARRTRCAVAAAMATALLLAACGGPDDEGASDCDADRGLDHEAARRMTEELLALAEAVALNADEAVRNLVETANQFNEEWDPPADQADCLPSLQDTELYLLTIQHLGAHPELATPGLMEYLGEAAEVGGTSGIGVAVGVDDDPDDPPPEFFDLRAAVSEQEDLLHAVTEERWAET
jgi:hypothetical protein